MPEDQSGQVTALLHHWRQGDENALQALVPLVYKELRHLAHCPLQAERPDHTLQGTALIHEAYLRWLGGEPVALQNLAHFTAIASRLMRKIIVDYSRERNVGQTGWRQPDCLRVPGRAARKRRRRTPRFDRLARRTVQR
jgi:RNA polymerase sigma factor (TIGR02999 family)